jgi:hypothetical protein
MEMKMATIWIIGRKVELPNGHAYMAEPFIAFGSNKAAQDACDMIQKVSGERPMITDAAINDYGATHNAEKLGGAA